MTGSTAWIAAVGLLSAALAAGCAPSGLAREDPAAAPGTPDAAEALEYPRWETVDPGAHTRYNQRANLIQRGREVYDLYCVGCHGEYGDGHGPAAERLITKPRDFTSGIYKFRSTDSSSLPMESDLYRTLTRGLYGVSMPAFPLMPHRDKLAVIEYIKTFYPRWNERKDRRKIIHVPKAPGDLGQPRRVLRGRVVYLSMQCNQCHGVDGQGTGATRTEYVDAWGNPQKPFNFTRGSLKGGNSPEDIYRTFYTGLRSIMPAYGETTLAAVSRDVFELRRGTISEEEYRQLEPALEDFPRQWDPSTLSESEQQATAQRNSWDLVAYILSLRQSTTTARAVLGTQE